MNVYCYEGAMEEKKKKKLMSCGCSAIFSLCVLIVILVIVYWVWGQGWLRISVAEETFESGDTGWLLVGDAQGESDTPTYETEGGNPGAYMSAVDDAVGGVWYWSAPESFLKQIQEKWGQWNRTRGRISFDLKQSSLDNPFEAKDVILGRGDVEFYYHHNEPPGVDWTAYTVPLILPDGWKNSATDEAVTKEEMLEMIEGLDRLWIRGEFRTGDDVGGIDNIRIW